MGRDSNLEGFGEVDGRDNCSIAGTMLNLELILSV